MKLHYLYECSVCGQKSEDKKLIQGCEAKHMGFQNMRDYYDYLHLRKQVEMAYRRMKQLPTKTDTEAYQKLAAALNQMETEKHITPILSCL